MVGRIYNTENQLQEIVAFLFLKYQQLGTTCRGKQKYFLFREKTKSIYMCRIWSLFSVYLSCLGEVGQSCLQSFYWQHHGRKLLSGAGVVS